MFIIVRYIIQVLLCVIAVISYNTVQRTSKPIASV